MVPALVIFVEVIILTSLVSGVVSVQIQDAGDRLREPDQELG